MARDLVLLPAPRKLTPLGGELDLEGTPERDRLVQLGPGDRDCLTRTGRTVREALQLVAGKRFRLAAGGIGDCACAVAVDPGRVGEPHGYGLSILRDGIRLVGHDEAGLFYGAQTLLQIARQHRGPAVAFRACSSATGPTFHTGGYSSTSAADASLPWRA